MPEPRGRGRPSSEPSRLSRELPHLERLSPTVSPAIPPGTLPLRTDFPAPIAEAGELFLTTGSAALFHGVRERIGRPDAWHPAEGSPWPTSVIEESTARGHIQLRPSDLDPFASLPPDELAEWSAAMFRQVDDLSALDADVVDGLSHLWIQRARSPEARVRISIDELLKLRGLKGKRSGSGRRGGFEPEQRREILGALARLQNIWLSMAEVVTYEPKANGKGSSQKMRRGIASRAFTVSTVEYQARLDGSVDIDYVIFAPGEMLALFLWGTVGRQTALLSAKALHFHTLRQAPEKALTRYLSWQWRIRSHRGSYLEPYRVGTLLEAAGLTLDEERPVRTRHRLEKALKTLQDEGIVPAWRYEAWTEGDAPARGWAPLWLQTSVVIEPPATIRKHYVRETSTPTALPMPSPTRRLGSIGERLGETRRRLQLSQAAAAEAAGMAQQSYSRAERGGAVSPANRTRLEAWLEANARPDT